jgi:hypothetical protein
MSFAVAYAPARSSQLAMSPAPTKTGSDALVLLFSFALVSSAAAANDAATTEKNKTNNPHFPNDDANRGTEAFVRKA